MPEATHYEIHIGNILDEKWAAYLAPFALSSGVDETILTGVVSDQAELFGLLLKIRDFGLRLVSVIPLPRQ